MKTLFTANRKKDIVIAFLLMIAIISFAICFTVFFKYIYYIDIDLLKISQYTGIEKEVIKHNYDILIQYQSIFYHGKLILPDFVMSESGRIHFEEVKRIFEIIQIVCVVSIMTVIPLIYKRFKEKEYRFLKLTAIFNIAIPSFIAMIACADFDRAFVIVHKILFRNDYWIFDSYSDPVIDILPQEFFMHCFLMIIIVVVVLSLVCYGIYKIKEKEVLEGDLK